MRSSSKLLPMAYQPKVPTTSGTQADARAGPCRVLWLTSAARCPEKHENGGKLYGTRPCAQPTITEIMHKRNSDDFTGSGKIPELKLVTTKDPNRLSVRRRNPLRSGLMYLLSCWPFHKEINASRQILFCATRLGLVPGDA